MGISVMPKNSCRYPYCGKPVTADGEGICCSMYHVVQLESGMDEAREVLADLELDREGED